MKYYDMIECSKAFIPITPPEPKITAPVAPEKTVAEESQKNTPVSTVEAQICQLTDLMHEIKEKIDNGTSTTESNKKTILTDKQVIEILERLTYFGEKYFKTIPLDDKMTKQFIWNIPKSMYKGMKKAIDNNLPDIYDPMFTFYISLSFAPDDAIYEFLNIMLDNTVFKVDNTDEIMENAANYRRLYQFDPPNQPDPNIVVDYTGAVDTDPDSISLGLNNNNI